MTSCCNCFVTTWPHLEFRMNYQRDLYLKQGLEQLADFLAATRSAAAPEVLHTEEWFDVQIAGTKVAGRIDRMDRLADGSVAIVDYKTGKARSQEDADESLQLSIYAMAAHEKWGYRVGELVFQNLEGNVAVVSKRAEFQLEEARERVQAVARGIAEGNFKPKPISTATFAPSAAYVQPVKNGLPMLRPRLRRMQGHRFD